MNKHGKGQIGDASARGQHMTTLGVDVIGYYYGSTGAKKLGVVGKLIARTD